ACIHICQGAWRGDMRTESAGHANVVCGGCAVVVVAAHNKMELSASGGRFEILFEAQQKLLMGLAGRPEQIAMSRRGASTVVRSSMGVPAPLGRQRVLLRTCSCGTGRSRRQAGRRGQA